MTDIAAIIEKLEAADGPNYAIEVEIFKLVHPEYADFIQGRGGLIHPQDGEDVRVQSNVRAPKYTASLDAAMKLARSEADGWRVENLCEWDHQILRDKGPWMCDLVPRGKDFSARQSVKCAHAPTPAIALCIAVLKAMNAKQVAA